jgi:16S rRNA G966 N2-methylase RsmD
MTEIYNNLLELKQISLDIAIADFKKLKTLDTNTTVNSRVGTKFIDYFTFKQRLHTRGVKNMNYLEFVSNNEYLNRPYIKNLIEYQLNKGVNPDVMLWEIFKFHCGCISSIKPITIKRILQIYKPVSVLDPFMGWGSSLVSCCSVDVPHFTGIEINTDLVTPYNEMTKKLTEIGTVTDIHLKFMNSCDVDFSKLEYDFVFTSPPYYNKEQYWNGSEFIKLTKEEWNKLYTDVFSAVYLNLKRGGYMCINCPSDIYLLLLGIFGNELTKHSLNQCKRFNNQYQEYIYIWKRF